MVLLAEGKAGANVDVDQAARYQQVQPDDVIRSASITIANPGSRVAQPVYVCQSTHVQRVLVGLTAAGGSFPLLAVSADQIEAYGAAFIDGDLNSVFPAPVPGLPPRYIPIDDESPDDEVDRLVLPALVAALSHRRPRVTVAALAEQAIAHLPLFGSAARGRLVKKVERSARGLAERDPSSFRFLPRTESRSEPAIEFVRTPEDADRRGRTQSYQAIARAGSRARRRQRTPMAGEATLFDELIDELEQSAEVAEDAQDAEEAEVAEEAEEALQDDDDQEQP